MMVTIRMSEEEKNLVTAYAKLEGRFLSEAMKRAFFEKIEDEYDLVLATDAYGEYKKDKTTYTSEEVRKELGL